MSYVLRSKHYMEMWSWVTIVLLHEHAREYPLLPLLLAFLLFLNPFLPFQYSNHHPLVLLYIHPLPLPLPLSAIGIPLPDRLNFQPGLHRNVEESHQLRPPSMESSYDPGFSLSFGGEEMHN